MAADREEGRKSIKTFLLTILPFAENYLLDTLATSVEREAFESSLNISEYEKELKSRVLILKEHGHVISTLLSDSKKDEKDDKKLDYAFPDVSTISCTNSDQNLLSVSSIVEREEDGPMPALDSRICSKISADNQTMDIDESAALSEPCHLSYLFEINDLQDLLPPSSVQGSTNELKFDYDYIQNCARRPMEHSIESGVHILTGDVQDKNRIPEINVDGQCKKRKIAGRSKLLAKNRSKRSFEKKGDGYDIVLTAKQARMKRLAKRRQKRHILSSTSQA